MANTKTKIKNQNTKNWLVKTFIIVGVLLFILYIYEWYVVKEQEKYINSYLIDSKTISLEMTEINEIDSVLSETGSYYFVYIGYTKDKNVYSLEKKLKPIIDDYDLHNNFYYINVTDIKEDNKNYIKDIASKLNIDSKDIKKVPVILYFKDGELGDKAIYSAKDFKNLLEEQGFDKM